MPKANADYERLLRYAQADLGHFATRLENTSKALTNALKDVPGKQSIFKLIEAHAGNVVDHADATARVERYTALIERKAQEPADNATAAS